MDERTSTDATKKRVWPRVLIAIVLIGVVVAAGVVFFGYAKYKYLRAHADQMLRDRVVASLSARFNSPVTLDSLHLDTSNGVHVTGTGLKILYLAGPTKPDKDATDPPPMVSVPSFEFQTEWKALLEPTTRIVTVYVQGMQLHIPPHSKDHVPRVKDNPKTPKQPKISLVFDKIVCTDSQLTIETSKPGKLPLVFEISNITLKDVGTTKPFVYDATLRNPRPVGDIHSTGHFGPWQSDDPRETPLDGNYSFTNADLGPFKGIAGILSSTGNFQGKLSHIEVVGQTDTPDFRLDISDHPVPLHTDFRATVNGVNGDTTLTQVDAKLLHSVIHASGSIYRVGNAQTGVTGHDTELTVTMDHGRIEDMLTLATKTNPPLLSGAMVMRQKLSIPPGKESVSKRVKLAGTFGLQGVTFGSPQMQQKIDELSMRATGHPKQANAQDATQVVSTMAGEFTLENAVMNISSVQYEFPGATLKMSGTYGLQSNSLDFQGEVLTQATMSQMTTGWKSMLLKPFDPLMKRDGAGVKLPITVKGTKSAPKFGVDTKKLFH